MYDPATTRGTESPLEPLCCSICNLSACCIAETKHGAARHSADTALRRDAYAFRMGKSLRFRGVFRVARGVRMNVSTLSESTSFGRRGASFTVGPRGPRSTIGLPGTGRSYTEQSHGGSGGVLFALVVIGLIIAAIALFA